MSQTNTNEIIIPETIINSIKIPGKGQILELGIDICEDKDRGRVKHYYKLIKIMTKPKDGWNSQKTLDILTLEILYFNEY